MVCVGCTHGELDVVYSTVAKMEQESGRRCDLVLCCGDFQAVRDPSDLESMAAPAKHLKMQDFHRYHRGERVAPVLTIFVGGNHEASAHLLHMPLGGWVAPNIYFLGHAGVVTFMGLRIGGVSGIFKSHDAGSGHWEEVPLSESSKRSVYHSRAIDAQLLGLAGPLDVVLSHDWPRCAAGSGDTAALLRSKPFLAEDVQAGRLGSPLLDNLAAVPGAVRLWLAAHLHVPFAAVLPGGARFLALDKPLPGRHFAQWIALPVSADAGADRALCLDGRWLAVLRAALRPDYFGRGRPQPPPALAVSEEPPLPCGGWVAGAPGMVTSSVLASLGLPELHLMRSGEAGLKRLRGDGDEVEEQQLSGPPPKDPNVLDISDE